MPPRHLINERGAPFEPTELDSIRGELDALEQHDRVQYRNANAKAIADHPATKMLVVSGPGTGKSHLFLHRIDQWFQLKPEASVLVTSFVRKLVSDLRADIDKNETLTQDQKKRTTASTLHRLARAIVEKNHGTDEWLFKPYFRIIGQSWKKIVWQDVLDFYPDIDGATFTQVHWEEQLHNNSFEPSAEWQAFKEEYFKLCKFYNAAGFADLIIRARIAVEENPHHAEHDFVIIDEYQDFNAAEEGFIAQLTRDAKAVLIVGDDEQVLYEKLKSGQAALIRNHYKDRSIANAMLPFSSRCGYHITKSAAHFIQQHQDPERIDKIFLPVNSDGTSPKVQIVACAAPATAVDYIAKFVDDHKQELDDRKEKLLEGTEKDAYILILTPARQVKFFGNSKQKLFEIVSAYRTEQRGFSEDYYKVLTYYWLARLPQNNFTLRKVFFYEGLGSAIVHQYIKEAIESGQDFCDLQHSTIKGILSKSDAVRAILDEEISVEEKIDKLAGILGLADKDGLKHDLQQQEISAEGVTKLQHEEEEEAELEEIEIKKMSAVELITVVGAKGLSADHVIIIGCDNMNMNWITQNAFYVAMTRARKSLHLLTSLKGGGAKKAHDFVLQIPETNAEFYKYTVKKHSATNLNSRIEFVQYFKWLNSLSKPKKN